MQTNATVRSSLDEWISYITSPILKHDAIARHRAESFQKASEKIELASSRERSDRERELVENLKLVLVHSKVFRASPSASNGRDTAAAITRALKGFEAAQDATEGSNGMALRSTASVEIGNDSESEDAWHQRLSELSSRLKTAARELPRPKSVRHQSNSNDNDDKTSERGAFRRMYGAQVLALAQEKGWTHDMVEAYASDTPTAPPWSVLQSVFVPGALQCSDGIGPRDLAALKVRYTTTSEDNDHVAIRSMDLLRARLDAQAEAAKVATYCQALESARENLRVCRVDHWGSDAAQELIRISRELHAALSNGRRPAVVAMRTFSSDV